jgi:hypothetical protein
MPRRRKWPSRGCSRSAKRGAQGLQALLHRLGRATAIACLVGAWTHGAASTPQAWSAYDQEVLTACVAASALRDVRPAGARVDFDDQIGYSALLIVGHYAQPHMNNRVGRELCLFDRRTRTASVSDAHRLYVRRSAAASASP